MTLPVPYQKKSVLLCVHGRKAFEAYVHRWFALSERIHTYWSNLLVTQIDKYEPDVMLWCMNNQAMSFRHVSGIRAYYPKLPIVLVSRGITLQPQQFLNHRCFPIDISDFTAAQAAVELQFAVAIAYKLVESADS